MTRPSGERPSGDRRCRRREDVEDERRAPRDRDTLGLATPCGSLGNNRPRLDRSQLVKDCAARDGPLVDQKEPDLKSVPPFAERGGEGSTKSSPKPLGLAVAAARPANDSASAGDAIHHLASELGRLAAQLYVAGRFPGTRQGDVEEDDDR